MFRCLCCGCATLGEQPPGTFEICPVCYWEDDNVQAKNPTLGGGANKVSLEEARRNFKTLGAISPEFVGMVRKPLPQETAHSDGV
jgi:hypothetical protein